MEHKEKLTEDQAIAFVNEKAIELTKLKGVEVLPILTSHNDDWVFGYFAAPTRFQIMRILGKGGEDFIFSGMSLLEENLLRDVSDPKYLSDNNAFNQLNIGAYIKAYKSVSKVSYDLSEKKIG